MAAALMAFAGCATAEPSIENARCEAGERLGSLPDELAESSGLAASRRHPGVLWTHNDSGNEPEVFAIHTTGHVLAGIRVAGAHNLDWEDLAAGPCPAGSCLYIADIGDNAETRENVAVYRISEPDLETGNTVPAEVFRGRYPDGPRDAEGLFVLPSGSVFIVSKGRSAPVAVYRFPLSGDGIATLERVRSLGETAPILPNQATGADASPDGRWVAVRTYTSLQLYRATEGGELAPALARSGLDLVPVLADPGVDLVPLSEPQGEGVAIRDDGTIFLSSEAGLDSSGAIGRVACVLP